ncbi:hypothetical protein AVEN_92451-1 [Araneus ventricosus]|uniref:Uncharacterized protein n=1 Tax=Araneus ventricosus TaxID=182803 RepID=A0A4Y2AJ63_ARAVE|nr:hypothetical protein AVEN_92451-1 [Araneus ventricosus]
MTETSIIPPCNDIFVDRLRNTMREMNPVATCTHGKTKFYVNPSLKTCSHVFLRIVSVKPPLCQPYTDPHKVLKRTKKNFTIELNGRTSTVSIDRVKRAHLIPTCEEKPILSAICCQRNLHKRLILNVARYYKGFEKNTKSS